MRPQKYKNEQISAGHFGEQKKRKVPETFRRSVFFLWPATEMRSFLLFVGGQWPQKKHRRPTERDCSRLPEPCTKPAFEDKMCPRRTK